MKRRIFSIVLLVAVLALAVALVVVNAGNAKTQSILTVLQKAKETAETSVTVKPHPKPGTAKEVFDIKLFAANLRKIDTLNCPKDFQNAWIDVVQTVVRCAGYGLGDAGIDLFSMLGVAHGRNGADGLAQRAEMRDVKESVNRLEKVCLKYNVRFAGN